MIAEISPCARRKDYISADHYGELMKIRKTTEMGEDSKQNPNVLCPFCIPEPSDIIIQNGSCYARWDINPITRGHALIIPFRHVPGFFDIQSGEQGALFSLANECRRMIDNRYASDGYNLGINIRSAAGQTIMHCHLHLIPRYSGDKNQVEGIIRTIIP
jgi:diadenosine tetraphosphate (Ap4A) HIT family hydrolase